MTFEISTFIKVKFQKSFKSAEGAPKQRVSPPLSNPKIHTAADEFMEYLEDRQSVTVDCKNKQPTCILLYKEEYLCVGALLWTEATWDGINSGKIKSFLEKIFFHKKYFGFHPLAWFSLL